MRGSTSASRCRCIGAAISVTDARADTNGWPPQTDDRAMLACQTHYDTLIALRSLRLCIFSFNIPSVHSRTFIASFYFCLVCEMTFYPKNLAICDEY